MGSSLVDRGLVLGVGAGAVLHEPMKCYLGAMVPASAPGSIYVKEIRGFLSKILFAIFLLSFFVKSLTVVARTRPDIIHAHWWVPSGIIAALVGKITGVPYVITSHGTDLFILRGFRFLRPLARSVIRGSRKMIVLSTPLKTLLVEELEQPEVSCIAAL